jgi:hypothetical protein
MDTGCPRRDFNKQSGVSISNPAVDDFSAGALKIKELQISGLWIKLYR